MVTVMRAQCAVGEPTPPTYVDLPVRAERIGDCLLQAHGLPLHIGGREPILAKPCSGAG